MMSRFLNQRRWFLFGLAYYLVWSVTWFIATGFGVFENHISLWYLPAGLRFFLLTVFGVAAAPLAALTEVAFSTLLLWIGPFHSSPLVASWTDRLEGALNPIVVYLGMALALRAWNARRAVSLLGDPIATISFLVAALVGSLATAGLGAARLLRIGFITPEQMLDVGLSWWIGDFIAIVALTPWLLWCGELRLTDWLAGSSASAQRMTPASAKRLWGEWAYLAGLLLGLLALFLFSHASSVPQPFLMLMLLVPLAMGAVGGGLAVATKAVFLLDAGLAVGVGWFGTDSAVLEYQVVMIAVAVTGLLLGSVSDAHQQAVAQYRNLNWLSNDLLWTTDAQGRLRAVQGPAADRFHWCIGRAWWRNFRALPQAQRAAFRAAVQARRPFRDLIVSMHNLQGPECWLRINGQPYQDRRHRWVGYRGSATDITLHCQAQQVLHGYAERLQREVAVKTADLWRTHQQLTLSEQRYRTMLATAPLGVAEVDRHGHSLYVNFAWCLWLEQPSAQAVLGQPWWLCLPADARPEIIHLWAMGRPLSSGDREFSGPSGRWLGVQWSLLHHPDGGISGALVVLTNLTDRYQREQAQWRLAHIDDLTQLPNRRLFRDRLDQALRQAQRQAQTVAVLWLDLDGFKAVNDTWGHAAGDNLLRQVGQRLHAGLRDSDTVARLGGDEFAVVLTTVAQASDATHVAQKLINAIREPFHLPSGPARVSTSVGIALYPDHAATSADLAQQADAAMYAAKSAGKNCWRLSSSMAAKTDPGFGNDPVLRGHPSPEEKDQGLTAPTDV